MQPSANPSPLVGAPQRAASKSLVYSSSSEKDVSSAQPTDAYASASSAFQPRLLSELHSKTMARESTFRMTGGTLREECCCTGCAGDCNEELKSERWDVFSTVHTAVGMCPSLCMLLTCIGPDVCVCYSCCCWLPLQMAANVYLSLAMNRHLASLVLVSWTGLFYAFNAIVSGAAV